jgi:anaerobic selenocysteine-containing dehydrogenase
VPEGRFLLTLRRGKQFNSMSYADRDPLTGGTKRADVLLDARDIRALGLHDGDPVRLESDAGTMTAHVRAGPCRRQHAQGYFPEANVLVSRKYDPASGEPDYATTVKIEKLAGAKGARPTGP